MISGKWAVATDSAGRRAAPVDRGPRRDGDEAPRAVPIRTGSAVLITLGLFIATDYKFRRRSLAESISGRPDIAILFELGVYALIAGALATLLGRVPIRLARLGAPLTLLLAFTAIAATSALWSPYPTLAAVRGGQLVIAIFAAVVVALHGTPRMMHAIAHGFLGLTVASALLGIVFRYDYRLDTLLAEPIPRYSWFVVHPVVAGVYLATAIVLAAAYVRGPRAGARWPRWIYWASIVVCFAALMATRTRASAGAAVVGLLVLFALTVRRVRWLDAAVVVALVGAIVVILGGATISEFLQRGQSTEELGSLSARTVLWSQALDRFGESPFAGFGLQAARGLFYETTKLGGGHNALINVLVETGIVGTICWGAAIGALAGRLLRLWRRPDLRSDVALLSALLAMHIVNAVTYEGFGSVINVAFLWLLLLVAWADVLRRRPSDLT